MPRQIVYLPQWVEVTAKDKAQEGTRLHQCCKLLMDIVDAPDDLEIVILTKRSFVFTGVLDGSFEEDV